MVKRRLIGAIRRGVTRRLRRRRRPGLRLVWGWVLILPMVALLMVQGPWGRRIRGQRQSRIWARCSRAGFNGGEMIRTMRMMMTRMTASGSSFHIAIVDTVDSITKRMDQVKRLTKASLLGEGATQVCGIRNRSQRAGVVSRRFRQGSFFIPFILV
ncbi:hypothetical protein F5H01DRAFT_175848 [Linnemannia elongata]|nr:hypothetical protein F5H01DRAFT_175848 [Linnemannia elongata]